MSRRTIALLLLILLPAACGRIQAAHPKANPDLALALTVLPSPPAVGAGQVLVTLTDHSGRPVRGASIHIECDMTHAGMVPVLADATEDGNQAERYIARVTWTMDGDWVVDVRATLPDGRATEQQFPVRIGD